MTYLHMYLIYLNEGYKIVCSTKSKACTTKLESLWQNIITFNLIMVVSIHRYSLDFISSIQMSINYQLGIVTYQKPN